MLKKTVTYEDPFNPGEEVTQTLYFNFTKAELVEMEVETGGLKEHLERIAEAQNGQQIMDEMKSIILKSYGKRTENNQFIKNDEIRAEFESSEAYSTLFMEMVTDANAAVVFVQGIMPKDLIDDAQLQMDDVARPNLAAVAEPKVLTRSELLEMDQAELRSGLAEGRYILGDQTAKL